MMGRDPSELCTLLLFNHVLMPTFRSYDASSRAVFACVGSGNWTEWTLSSEFGPERKRCRTLIRIPLCDVQGELMAPFSQSPCFGERLVGGDLVGNLLIGWVSNRLLERVDGSLN